MNTTEAAGLLLHLTSSETCDVSHAVRILANARESLPEWPLTLVIQGAAVAAARSDSITAYGLHHAGTIANAEVAVCGNSLTGLGIGPDDLAAEVTIVPAAVGYLAQQQARGWSYVRI